MTLTKIQTIASGTGATVRTIDSKLEDVVSVKDFGALGDNSNDDTAELQAALNAAAGKTLLMPKGIYLISKTLIIPEGTRIIGSGKADISEEDYTKGTVIKTTGSGNAQVWTDITSGTDATQTPCLVAGGNGIYIENLTVLTNANHWSIGILYPCVKQCSVSKVSMRGFTNACLYLDVSRSNLNKPTVTDQASTSVTINCGTGMNEFYAEDFIFRSNTNGVSDFGIKIQGTTRDTSPVGITYVTPTDSTTQSAVDSAASGSNPFWVWGWGGASDIVFNSGRTSGISIDGALSTNVAKKIQGQRFIAVDSRVSTDGVLVNIDRAHRVDFISGYGEVATSKIKFTHRTGIVNFLFTNYTGEVNYLKTGGSTTQYGLLGSTSVSETVSGGTYGRSSDTVTVTKTNHNLITGDSITANFTGGATDGIYEITRVDANTFTLTDSASGTISTGTSLTYDVIVPLTVYTHDGLFLLSQGKIKLTANSLSPEANNAFSLGSSQKNFVNVRTRKVEADSADLVLDSDTNIVRPDANDDINLGIAATRFKKLFVTNATDVSSDRNLKQDIADLTAAEKKVAVACKSLLKKFKYKSAVATEGDAAQIHFGIIAQDLKTAFEAEGLNADNYGMLSSNTVTDKKTGQQITSFGVLYTELLAFVISSL